MKYAPLSIEDGNEINLHPRIEKRDQLKMPKLRVPSQTLEEGGRVRWPKMTNGYAYTIRNLLTQ